MKIIIKYFIPILIISYILFVVYKYQERQSLTKEEQPQESKTVVTSFYPMYIHTSRLMEGTDLTLINMASETVGCLHDYQLTTEDVKKLYEADLLITNGVDEQSLIEKVYQQNENLEVINASEKWLQHVGEEEHNHEEEHSDEEAHTDEEEHDHVHTMNEHVWLSLEGAKLQVETIAEKLMSYDVANAATYEKNKKVYLEELEELHQLQQTVKDEGYLAAVTVHNTFDYLLEDLGVDLIATLPEGMYENPSPKEVETIIQQIRVNEVKVIFTEERYKDLTLLHTIQKETGVEVVVLDGMLTSEGQGTNYKELMLANIETIKAVKK